MKKPTRLPWLTLVITISAIVIALIPGAPEAMQWNHGQDGEKWRLFTSNLAHWNISHLFWDLLIFAVLGSLVEHNSRRVLIAVYLGTSLLFGAMLCLYDFEFNSYRGISGVDSGLMSFLAVYWLVDAWHQHDRRLFLLAGGALAGFLFKLYFEFAKGDTLFVSTNNDFVPVPEAHVAGGFIGILTALVFSAGKDGRSRSLSKSDDILTRHHLCT